ncbi:MAG: hypothetical protein WC608_05310 [Parcubacteria group bacterium]
MKKSFLNIFSAIVVSAFVFAFLPALPAQAGPDISVSFGAGFPLNKINAAPGDSVSGNFAVTNHTGDTQSLMINLKIQQGVWQALTDNIEEKLLIKIKKPNGTFATMPNGNTEQFLSEINDDPFTFDTIHGPDGHTKTYELSATFDVNAGNEYQGKTVIFDIIAGIHTTPTASGGGGGGGGGGGAPETGLLAVTFTAGGAPGGLTGGGVIGPGEVQGAVEEEVAGAETGCSEWPLWVWLLILAIFTGVFNYISFYNYKERKDFRWFWQLALTVAVFLVWLYFDKCDLYLWFPYVLIILGLVSYWYYLHRLRKAVAEEQGQIKTG